MSKTNPTAQERAQKRYDAKTARWIGLKLNKNTDRDVIEKLESVPSMQGYIKMLIRADIARSEGKS